MYKYKICCVLLLFIVVVIHPVNAASQAKVLTPEMVVNLNTVSEIALGSRGEFYAYTLQVPRTDLDSPGPAHVSELWVGSLEGDEPRQYTFKPRSVRSLRWAPGGEWIAFLSMRRERDPNTQVYAIPVDGGEARRLTSHETSILSYRWSPDGTRLAYIAADPQTEEEKTAAKSGRDWILVDQNHKFNRLWITNIANGETRKIYDEDLHAANFVWTPDGKSMVFQASDKPGFDHMFMFQKLYRISLNDGAPEVITTTPGKLGDMAVSPDGSRLAYLGAVSQNDPIAQNLFVVSASGGQSRNLTEGFKGTARSVQWLDDSSVLLLAVEGVNTAVYSVDVRSGRRSRIIRSGPILNSINVHAEFGRFVAAGHTPEHPAEVFTGTLDDGRLFKITDHNPFLASVRLAKQEVVEWKSKDGWNIQGILTYPLDYEPDQRYPLVLQIHGGPEGIDVNGWNTRAGYPVQLLAARGYMVLQPNYRGSAGRGVEYSKADHNDLGGSEFTDVLAGVDALIDRGLVDSERVGTGGWSYGGYFTGWAATRYSTRFKAAVFCAGISNWISFTGTTEIPYEMSIVHWNSWWYDHPELHWERSPLAHINTAQTPTLIVHGTEDSRVAPGQGIELYTALKIKNIPTQLVLYPREGHGLSERAHQLDFMQRVLDWFDRYLK